VRRAVAADMPAIASLVATVAAEGRYILTEPPVDEPAFARSLDAATSRGDAVVWVLVREGRVVGELSLFRTAASGVVALGIALLPAARGRGGGHALMRAAIDHARDVGMHKIELDVFPDNTAAVALYARCGFAVEGFRRDHFRRRDGSLASALLMALPLPGDAGG
jgi:RimJ/RimL family protein N-acetyltransferase